MKTPALAALAVAVLTLAGSARAAAVDPVEANYERAAARLADAAAAAPHSVAVVDQVPVEYAALLITFSYGSRAPLAVTNPTQAAVTAMLSEKRADWTAVKAALDKKAAELAAEEFSLDAERRNTAMNPGDPMALARSMRLSNRRYALEFMSGVVSKQQALAEAVLQDIDADSRGLAALETPAGREALIARKRALYAKLAASTPAATTK